MFLWGRLRYDLVAIIALLGRPDGGHSNAIGVSWIFRSCRDYGGTDPNYLKIFAAVCGD